MAKRIESRNLDSQLQEIERRLDRLERLALLGFQEIREVSEYAYEAVLQDPETLKRLSWKRNNFRPISDNEATEIGLKLHEIAVLKQAMRVLRKQTRLDVLGIVRDLVRHTRADTKLKKAA